MNSDHIATPGLIDWVFVLLSATVVWQMDLPAFFGQGIESFGAQPGSPLYHLFVDIFPPMLLVGLAWVSTFVYKNWLWPRIPESNYRNGWWVYGLTAHGEDNTPVQVVGHFYIDHDPDSIRIPDGKAYIIEDGKIARERGSWSSNTVWVDEQTLKIIFKMKAVNKSGLPENYEGLIDVDRTVGSEVVGNAAYKGQFYDLDREDMVLGNVYAERISSRNSYNSEQIVEILSDHTHELVNRSQLRELPTS